MRFEEVLRAVRADYPQLRVRPGKKFMYRAPRTIFYEKTGDFEQKDDTEGVSADKNTTEDVSADKNTSQFEQNWYVMQLLHELGHALLGHVDFRTDVDRVRMEREAWEKARALWDGYRERYGEAWQMDYDEEYVETAMDSYRDWLHRRSKCPVCGETRYQTADGQYHCVFCENFGKNV